jgi:hypothetical protein
MKTVDQGIVIGEGCEDYIGVDYQGYLDAGETIASGAVTAVDGLTLGSVVPLAAPLVMRGVTVPVGCGFTLTVKGQLTTGSPYTVPVTITTSAGRKDKVGWVFTTV